ncbi:MAG: hypothetical protein WDN72_07235 [Alphaproteobacteria bacterium]
MVSSSRFSQPATSSPQGSSGDRKRSVARPGVFQMLAFGQNRPALSAAGTTGAFSSALI